MRIPLARAWRPVMAIALTLGAIGTLTAVATAAPKAPAQKDLLGAVVFERNLEKAIASSDSRTAKKYTTQLQKLFHGLRDSQPSWFTSKGGDLMGGGMSVKDMGHMVAQGKGGLTLDNVDMLDLAIAQGALIPVYPVVGQAEMLYHDLYQLKASAGRKFDMSADVVKSMATDLAALSKACDKALTAELAAVNTAVKAVQAAARKKSADTTPLAEAAQKAIDALQRKAGVPAK